MEKEIIKYNKVIEKNLDDVKHKILVDMISFSSIKKSETKGPHNVLSITKNMLNVYVKVKTLTDLEIKEITLLVNRNSNKNVDITFLVPESIIIGNKSYTNKDTVVFYLEHKT